MNNKLNKITADNFMTAYYELSGLKAFISLHGEPDLSNDVKIGYAVTVTNSDNEELFQEIFDDLLSAINYLEKRYSTFDFQELKSENGDSSGCGSCAAH